MSKTNTKEVLLSRMAELRKAIIQTTKDTIIEWAEYDEAAQDVMLEQALDWGSPKNWEVFYRSAAESEATTKVVDLINEDGYTPCKALLFVKDYYTTWSPNNWQSQNKRKWALAHLENLLNCILYKVQDALAQYRLCKAFVKGLA